LPLTLANYTGQTYTFTTEQQFGPRSVKGLHWGVRFGGFLSQLNQAAGGAPIYTGRGLTFGFWTTH
jgi:hypothetical protein